MEDDVVVLQCVRCDQRRVWVRDAGPPGECWCRSRMWRPADPLPTPAHRRKRLPDTRSWPDLPSEQAGRNVLVGLSLVAAYHAGFCAGQPRGNY